MATCPLRLPPTHGALSFEEWVWFPRVKIDRSSVVSLNPSISVCSKTDPQTVGNFRSVGVVRHVYKWSILIYGTYTSGNIRSTFVCNIQFWKQDCHSNGAIWIQQCRNVKSVDPVSRTVKPTQLYFHPELPTTELICFSLALMPFIVIISWLNEMNWGVFKETVWLSLIFWKGIATLDHKIYLK